MSEQVEALNTIATALGDFDAARIDSITVTRRIGNALHMAGAKWDNAQRRYGFDVAGTRDGEDHNGCCAQCKGMRNDLAPGRDPEELCDPCYDDAVAILATTPARNTSQIGEG